jgi:hypothetical protein
MADAANAEAARRRSPWPRLRRWAPRALYESALIVFSVLLAFALNEAAQARAQRERAARALDGVRRELVANRAAAELARRNHRRTVTLVARFDSLRRPLPDSVWFGGMFNPAPQLASAWESARAAGVLAQLPYDLVLELSGVYADQARYVAMSTSIAEAVYGDMVRSGVLAVFRDRARNFAVLANDWSLREGVLIAECDSAVAHIDAAARRGAPRPPR